MSDDAELDAWIEANRVMTRDAEAVIKACYETLQTAQLGQSMLDAEYLPVLTPDGASMSADEYVKRIFEANEPVRATWRAGLRIATVFGVAVTHTLQNLRSHTDDFDKWWSSRQARISADPICRHFYLLRSVILKQGYFGLFEFPGGVNFETDDAGNVAVRIDGTWYFHEPRGATGHLVPREPVPVLLTAYLRQIEELVDEAKARFAPDFDPRPALATYNGPRITGGDGLEIAASVNAPTQL